MALFIVVRMVQVPAVNTKESGDIFLVDAATQQAAVDLVVNQAVKPGAPESFYATPAGNFQQYNTVPNFTWTSTPV